MTNTLDNLRANLNKLIGPGRRFPTTAKLAAEAGIGTATVQRARSGVGAIRLHCLDSIARAAGLETWQLLLADLDVDSPPTIYDKSKPQPAWPFAELISPVEYQSLPDDVRMAIWEYVEMKVSKRTQMFRQDQPKAG